MNNSEHKKTILTLKEAKELAHQQAEGQSQTKEKNQSSIVNEITLYYKNLQEQLLTKIKGQDQAIEKICQTLFNKELLFDEKQDSNECYASFFLFGAPGTGKSYTAETLAKIMDVPVLKVEMAQYSFEGDQIGLIGSDKQFRLASQGILTSFVEEKEKQLHILIFDEIEKAHKQTLDIFLQMLGSGKLYDPFKRNNLSLKRSIIFFTSNSGKDLYKDNNNLTNVSTRKLLEALEKDTDINGKRRLSAEFCSRIVSGTPVVFNNLKISDLKNIAMASLKDISTKLKNKRELSLKADKNLPLAFLYMNGQKDARIIANRFEDFVLNKLYSVPFDKYEIKTINFDIDYKTMPKEIKKLYFKEDKYNLIYIGNNENLLKSLSLNKYNISKVGNSEELSQAMRKDVDLVLVDPLFGGLKDKLISITDYNSKGIDLFYELMEIDNDLDVYILTNNKSMINEKDKQSLIEDGAKDLISTENLKNFDNKVSEIVENLYVEKNIKKLSNKGLLIDCKDKLVVDKNNKQVSILLTKFRKYMDYDSMAVKLMLKEEDKADVFFDDIVGAKNAKKELRYFINYLRDPLSESNRKLKAPKGILLYGPPGTGKTMLAKAMAKEASVNYISLNGADLLGLNTASGIVKVEEVFNSAKKYAPTIIFVDEIDAIAKKRVGLDQEAILNSLLTQMDGFKTNVRKPVFVLAATNFPIVANNGVAYLDEAIVRRFDCQIYVDLPNKEERIIFINKYLHKKDFKLAKKDIQTLGECSVGFSLANLENIMELAIRNCLRENKNLQGSDLLEAFDEYNGGEKRELKKIEAYMSAIHETGHAMAMYLLGQNPVYITIEARANYGGYVNMGEDKKDYLTKEDLLNKICIALAGRASEEVFFKEEGITTGAAADLRKATILAERIVKDYGMNGKLAVYENRNKIDENEIEDILQSEYNNIKTLLRDYKKDIEKIAKILLEKNHLTGKEFKELLKK